MRVGVLFLPLLGLALLAVLGAFTHVLAHPSHYWEGREIHKWRQTQVPQSWIDGYNTANFLYSTDIAPTNFPQIGNGWVATFINSTNEYWAPVFNGPGINVSHRARVPATTALVLMGQDLVHVAWGLDLVCGKAYRLWSAPNNITVTQTWYAPRDFTTSLIAEVEINATNSPSSYDVYGFINSGPPSPDIKITGSVANQTTTTTTAQTLVPEEPFSSVHYLTIVSTNVPEFWHTPAGEVTTFQLITTRSVTTPDKAAEGLRWAQATYDQMAAQRDMAKAKGLQNDFNQCAAWGDLHQHTLIVGGNAELARVVNASQYDILSSIHQDISFSTSPGGLSTNGYNGHTFWDQETWIYPTFALLNPQLAYGSILQYRIDRVVGALNKSASYGFKGAMWPWEDAYTGWDVCPVPANSEFEIHINSDILVAIEQMYQLTRNHTVLLETAGVWCNTATFWASRAECSGGECHINGVIPPDEYHFGNDSVYTNYAATRALRFAVQATKLFTPERVCNATAAEIALWETVADQLVILYNATLNIHPDFAGYNGSVVKQADVILLNYPLQMSMSESTIASDLAYYASRTDPGGPAMTWSMFSVGFNQVGQNALADSYFKKGYDENIFSPFYGWTEVAGGGGCQNFLTGAGGFLQSIWAGYFGLRFTDNALVFSNPRLLPTASYFEIQNFSYGSMQGVWAFTATLNATHFSLVFNPQIDPQSTTFNAVIGGSSTPLVPYQPLAVMLPFASLALLKAT